MKKYTSIDFSRTFPQTMPSSATPSVPFEVWAGQLTHDLKTPLATIKAFAELAHMQLKQKEQTSELYFLEQINAQVDILTAKLNRFLKEVPRTERSANS